MSEYWHAVRYQRAVMHSLCANERLHPSFDEPQERLRVSLVAKEIAALPEIPKKILALYYSEGLHFAEIALVLGFSEVQVSQIHDRSIAALLALRPGGRE